MKKPRLHEKWVEKELIFKTVEEVEDSGGLYDGDVMLTLWRHGVWIAMAGYSTGLEAYYKPFFTEPEPREDYIERGLIDEKDFEPFDRAIEAAQGLRGIVHMQALPNTQRIRGGIEYHNILMEGLEQMAQAAGPKINFFLPARLNRWVSPIEIWESITRDDELAHMMKNLPKNYDRVAERQGFTFDEVSGLYLRD